MTLYFLVGVMLSAVSTFSFAAIAYGPTYLSSAAAACAVQVASVGDTNPSVGIDLGGSVQCLGKLPYLPYQDHVSGQVAKSYRTCDDLAWVGTPQTCTCTFPQVWDSVKQSCSAPACPAAGSVIGSGSSVYSGSGQLGGALEICISSCSVTTGGCSSSKKTDGSWSWGCVGPFTAVGSSCTGTAVAVPPTDPKAACIAKGQGFVEMSGAVVCVPPTTVTTPTKTTSTPAAGGGSPSTTNNNTNTTCTGDGSCTTTTTTTTTSGGSGPGGTGPGSTTTPPTETKTETPKAAFCEENPQSTVCSNICQEQPDLLQCKTLGEAGIEPNIQNQNKGVGSITPFAGGSGSCPATVSLPRGAAFSYAPMCNFASGVRPIVLAIAWLLAGGMIFAWFRS